MRLVFLSTPGNGRIIHTLSSNVGDAFSVHAVFYSCAYVFFLLFSLRPVVKFKREPINFSFPHTSTLPFPDPPPPRLSAYIHVYTHTHTIL